MERRLAESFRMIERVSEISCWIVGWTVVDCELE